MNLRVLYYWRPKWPIIRQNVSHFLGSHFLESSVASALPAGPSPCTHVDNGVEGTHTCRTEVSLSHCEARTESEHEAKRHEPTVVDCIRSTQFANDQWPYRQSESRSMKFESANCVDTASCDKIFVCVRQERPLVRTVKWQGRLCWFHRVGHQMRIPGAVVSL